VVVLSSYSDRSFIAEAYRLRADGYIKKGHLSLKDFQQEIQDLLERDNPPIIDYDLNLKQREKKRIERRLRNVLDQIDILEERELNLSKLLL
jgi:DNA-binding NarL/FixJ family response regulator